MYSVQEPLYTNEEATSFMLEHYKHIGPLLAKAMIPGHPCCEDDPPRITNGLYARGLLRCTHAFATAHCLWSWSTLPRITSPHAVQAVPCVWRHNMCWCACRFCYRMCVCGGMFVSDSMPCSDGQVAGCWSPRQQHFVLIKTLIVVARSALEGVLWLYRAHLCGGPSWPLQECCEWGLHQGRQ